MRPKVGLGTFIFNYEILLVLFIRKRCTYVESKIILILGKISVNLFLNAADLFFTAASPPPTASPP